MTAADDTLAFPPGATPRALGYRWPAEWEPQAALWVAWPHNPNTWPGKFAPVPAAFAQFVRAVAAFQPVRVLAGGADVWPAAQRHLDGVANVSLVDIPTNDAWCRDHGPTFLSAPPGAPAALVDWRYNAWGGKYPPFELDDAVPARIAALTGRRRFAPGIVMEGGAVETNGAGLLLTTRSCLLNPNRNPGLGQAEVERYLADYYGAEQVLWLDHGDLAGDDTDGHIDQLARFVGPGVVVAAACRDRADENYEPLAANLHQLRSFTTRAGQPLQVLPLHLPEPKYYDDQRLPASYCNFVIVNGAVLVPTFDDPADDDALALLGRCFPERQVIGLDAVDLIWGLGAFHCLSQQEAV